jgi:GT2 family glycosyltransferase
MSHLISILIPAYNHFSLTRQCLLTLLENTDSPQEIVIVDNASTDQTSQSLPNIAQEFISSGWSFKIIRLDVNQGFGRAVNAAFRASSSESYIAILGNDTWVMPGWDAALSHAIKELNADMIGPYVDETPFDQNTIKEKAFRFISKNKHRSIPLWESALMFFKKSSFEQIGLFDERFYLTYEDADLQKRMDQANMRYFQVGCCYMWHKGKATRGEETSYEKEGLKIFMEKWGYDPRVAQHTWAGRIKRRWKRIRNGLGYL